MATVAVLGPLGWYWQSSRLPSSYSVMDMGYLDFGSGPGSGARAAGRQAGADAQAGAGAWAGAAHQHTAPVPPSAAAHQRVVEAGRSVSVADLRTDPSARPDVHVDLVARRQAFTLAGGRRVEGYTLNGRSPGPVVEATEGQLVEVSVRNDNVADGMTLHWHGLDVPNGEDGVAGVTQDAVMPGQSFTYRFVADEPGTYWYHSHQVSHEQVVGGLFGPLVIHAARAAPRVVDALAVAHVYDGRSTLNGREGEVPVPAEPGQVVRLRVVNTDNGPTQVWASAPFTVVAVDARDVHEPQEVSGQSVTVTAGGRVDLEVRVPDSGAVRVVDGGGPSVLVGPPGSTAPTAPQPSRELDLLTYGHPAPVGFDTARPDRSFTYSIGRRPGFVDGRPGLWWSVNGHLLPNLPMFVVGEGDVVRVTITNHSGDVHPMHLHGHHAVVLSRNGAPATGSPWWVDSLNVRDGDTYVVAFLADNPGIWMDHCHNLRHAAEGLVTHLMYEGVTEPFRVGGRAGNEPE